MSIGNLQLDSMLDDSISVIFAPSQVFRDHVLNIKNYDDLGDLEREFKAIEPIEKVFKKKEKYEKKL